MIWETIIFEEVLEIDVYLLVVGALALYLCLDACQRLLFVVRHLPILLKAKQVFEM